MLDVLLSLELLHLQPSSGGIISCHQTDSVGVKLLLYIATYANVQATLQGESLRVKSG